jgi:hypothetical protein
MRNAITAIFFMASTMAFAAVNGAAGQENPTPAASKDSQEVVKTLEKDGISIRVTARKSYAVGTTSPLNITIKCDKSPYMYKYENMLPDIELRGKRNGVDTPRTAYTKIIWETKSIKMSSDFRELKPGQEMNIALNINTFVDISRIGNYELTVSWYAFTPDGKNVAFEVPAVPFTVSGDPANVVVK